MGCIFKKCWLPWCLSSGCISTTEWELLHPLWIHIHVCTITYMARYGPLVRCVKLRIAHEPEMPGTFSPPPRVSNPDMHHGTCVTHVPWCMPGSLTSGFLWSLWPRKRFRHSRCMHNLQFYVSGKRPMSFHEASYKQKVYKCMCLIRR